MRIFSSGFDLYEMNMHFKKIEKIFTPNVSQKNSVIRSGCNLKREVEFYCPFEFQTLPKKRRPRCARGRLDRERGMKINSLSVCDSAAPFTRQVNKADRRNASAKYTCRYTESFLRDSLCKYRMRDRYCRSV